MGDEGLREYFLQSFPGVSWSVVSASPAENELCRLPCGVRSFFSFRWIATVRAIAKADAVVFGGGTLFTDAESVKACILWSLHAWCARLLRTPIFLSFQGVGPFKTRVSEWCARSVFRCACYVSVRDMYSYDRIKKWNLSTEIVQTFDPLYSSFYTQKNELSIKKVFIAIPRINSGAMFEESFKNLLQNAWDSVHILSMHSSSSSEQGYCEHLQSLVPNASVLAVSTLQDLCLEISRASVVVSERYHGALAAMALGVPVHIVVQSSEDKLQSLVQYKHASPKELQSLVQTGHQSLQKSLQSCCSNCGQE